MGGKLERPLPLFTELPRRVLLENSPAYARIPIPYWGVWCQHVCSPNRREEFFSETQFPTLDILGNSEAENLLVVLRAVGHGGTFK
jgi:hypothetical protein